MKDDQNLVSLSICQSTNSIFVIFQAWRANFVIVLHAVGTNYIIAKLAEVVGANFVSQSIIKHTKHLVVVYEMIRSVKRVASSGACNPI